MFHKPLCCVFTLSPSTVILREEYHLFNLTRASEGVDQGIKVRHSKLVRTGIRQALILPYLL